MKKPITIRIDTALLESMKVRAASLNSNVTNYIETLIKNDISEFEENVSYLTEINREDRELKVFFPAASNERFITAPQDGDTPEDVAMRQERLDALSILAGWDGKVE